MAAYWATGPAGPGRGTGSQPVSTLTTEERRVRNSVSSRTPEGGNTGEKAKRHERGLPQSQPGRPCHRRHRATGPRFTRSGSGNRTAGPSLLTGARLWLKSDPVSPGKRFSSLTCLLSGSRWSPRRKQKAFSWSPFTSPQPWLPNGSLTKVRREWGVLGHLETLGWGPWKVSVCLSCFPSH